MPTLLQVRAPYFPLPYFLLQAQKGEAPPNDGASQ
jgi:hypothetical protein